MSKLARVVFLFTFSIGFLNALPSSAGKSRPHRHPTTQDKSAASQPQQNPPNTIPEPQTLESIQKNFEKLHKSPKARQIKNAFAAFQNNDFLKAIRLANSTLQDPNFSDYGFWISAQAHRELAANELKKRKFSNALSNSDKAFNLSLKIESDHPQSPFVKNFGVFLAQSELLKAESYWGLKKSKLSQVYYEKAFQRISMNSGWLVLKPEFLNHYATGCKKSENPVCIAWLKKLSGIYAKQGEASQALSEAYPLQPEKKRYFRNPNRLTVAYKAPDQDAAAFENAFKLYLDEKYKDSLKAFDQFFIDFPKSSHQGRARYWQAKATQRAMGPDPARELFSNLLRDFPLTYYGLLASRDGGSSLDPLISNTLPAVEVNEPSLLPQEQFHLNRAESFLAENEPFLASLELRDFKAKENFSSPFLFYLAMLSNQARNYSLLFNILGELIQRGADGALSNYVVELIFPKEYFDIINKYAAETRVDPILVLSLVKQESSFEKAVNSFAGAMGLMQLMPATALETDSRVNLSDLLEAPENIRVGVLYLAKLLNRYKGNIVYALGAYNAGPTAMDRWIKAAPPKGGMEEFIETIPYRETREYVAAIIRNYYWYTRLVKPQAKREGTFNFQYFWKIEEPDSSSIKKKI